MKICGIDYSFNAPGIVVFELDADMKIIDKDYLTFTHTKKDMNDKVLYYNKNKKNPTFKFDIQQMVWMRDKVFEFVKDCDYCAIEDYAFKGNGQITKLAESLSKVKTLLYENNIPYRLYAPSSIKMFYTDNGTAKKEMMAEFYLRDEDKFDFEVDMSKLKKTEDVIALVFNTPHSLFDIFLSIHLKLFPAS